jgi:hypothetical protein
VARGRNEFFDRLMSIRGGNKMRSSREGDGCQVYTIHEIKGRTKWDVHAERA